MKWHTWDTLSIEQPCYTHNPIKWFFFFFLFCVFCYLYFLLFDWIGCMCVQVHELLISMQIPYRYYIPNKRKVQYAHALSFVCPLQMYIRIRQKLHRIPEAFPLFIRSKSDITHKKKFLFVFGIKRRKKKHENKRNIELTWCPISISVSLNPNSLWCVEWLVVFLLHYLEMRSVHSLYASLFVIHFNVSHFWDGKRRW